MCRLWVLLGLGWGIVGGWLVGGAEGAEARERAPLTVVQDILELNRETAESARPVSITGMVLFQSSALSVIYVADITATIRVNGVTNELALGDVVRVEGATMMKYAPEVRATTVTRTGRGPLPFARTTLRMGLLTGNEEHQWRSTAGVATKIERTPNALHITLTVTGGIVDTYVFGPIEDGVEEQWLHKRLVVTGVVRTVTNERGQLNGGTILVPSLAHVRGPAAPSVASGSTTLTGGQLEVTERGLAAVKGKTNALAGYQRVISSELMQYGTSTRRVVVTGTVLFQANGQRIYCVDETGPIRVLLKRPETVRVGDRLEVEGYPSVIDMRPWMTDAEVKRLDSKELPKPVRLGTSEALKGVYDGMRVTMRGRIVGHDNAQYSRSTREGVVAQDETGMFRANFYRGTSPWTRLPVGAVVEFTGMCVVEGLTPSGGSMAHVYLSGMDQTRVVENAPFWTARTFGWFSILVLALAGVVFGGVMLQRRQLEAVRASEERFRALVEHSFDITLVMNADGSVRYTSPSGTRLFGEGCKPGARLHEHITEIIHADDVEKVREAFAAVLEQAGNSRRLAACRIRTPGGELRSVEAIGTNCLRVIGVEGVVINLRDITERRRAEQQLENSALVQRRINEFATSLSPVHTEDDILWEITRQCIAVLGFTDCVIYMLTEDGGGLEQRAAYGPKNPRDREILNPIVIPVGQGIVGSVASTGVAEIIPDTRWDPRYIVDDESRLSEITVPIVAGGRVLGVIDSEHPVAGFFTEEHLDVLRSIASLCANKLVRSRAERRLLEMNAELEQRIEERTVELRSTNERLQAEVEERGRAEKVQKALFDISEAVHAAEDLEHLYQRIHSIVGTLMPAENFYLALQDAETGVVSFPYHRDQVDEPPKPRRGARGITEYVLRTGRATLANWEAIRCLVEAGEYTQTGNPARIWLGVPLTAQGRTFGVMAVQDHDDETAFGEEEKLLLVFVAEQVAQAIERKRSQAELRASADRLRQSEERFSKAFRASPIILSIARLADGQFIDVNEAFLAAVGLSREEVIGHTSQEIGLWRNEGDRESFVEELRRNGCVRNREFVIYKRNEPRSLLLSAEMILIGDDPCIVSVSADISERQQAEQELLRTLARERDLSQLKSRFVATISHEFRTPLGIVLASADILDRYFERLEPDQRREHLRDIQESALGMARQMENVLVFGRIEANRLQFNPATVDLVALCANLIQQTSTATERRTPIRLTHATPFPVVRADAALMGHIVMNLLSNAVKYSPAGAEVHCALEMEGAWVSVRVCDRGIGIPEKDRPHLFMPFQRGSNVAGVAGTGMGLTIVKRCVELHEGEMQIESAEGAGTMVTVRWRGLASELGASEGAGADRI